MFLKKQALLLFLAFLLASTLLLEGKSSDWEITTMDLLLKAQKSSKEYTNLSEYLKDIYLQMGRNKNESITNSTIIRDRAVVSLILSYCYAKLGDEKKRWKWSEIFIVNYSNPMVQLNFANSNLMEEEVEREKVKDEILNYRQNCLQYYTRVKGSKILRLEKEISYFEPPDEIEFEMETPEDIIHLEILEEHLNQYKKMTTSFTKVGNSRYVVSMAIEKDFTKQKKHIYWFFWKMKNIRAARGKLILKMQYQLPELPSSIINDIIFSPEKGEFEKKDDFKYVNGKFVIYNYKKSRMEIIRRIRIPEALVGAALLIGKSHIRNGFDTFFTILGLGFTMKGASNTVSAFKRRTKHFDEQHQFRRRKYRFKKELFEKIKNGIKVRVSPKLIKEYEEEF